MMPALLLVSMVRLLIVAGEQLPIEWWQPLAQGGSGAAVSGALLIWFALRMEKILEGVRGALERNTVSNMISVLNTKHLDEAIRPMAETLKQQAEESLRV